MADKLSEELSKQIIRKLEKRYVHSFFIDNIWVTDPDIYSKHAWVVPLKDKKFVTITNAFQKILDNSNRKPNKIWINKGTSFTINQ